MYWQLLQLMYETACQHKAQFAVCIFAPRNECEEELLPISQRQYNTMDSKELAVLIPQALPFDYVFLGDGKEGATSNDDLRLYTFPDPIMAHPGPLRNANWAKNIGKYVKYKLLGGPVFTSVDQPTAFPKGRDGEHLAP